MTRKQELWQKRGQIVKEYNGGMSICQLQLKYDCSYQQIVRVLHAENVKIKPHAEMIDLFHKGRLKRAKCSK